QGNEWRGTIRPPNWTRWFDHYREAIRVFAAVARDHHADVFVMGSELVSSEGQTEQWKQTIREVREIVKGQLAYSANWDHYAHIQFWEDLDFVGMNSYWQLGTRNN